MKDGRKYKKEMIITPDYYNFDMKQDIELIKRVTSETGVNQAKVDQIIGLVKDLQNSKNIQPLIEALAHCP